MSVEGIERTLGTPAPALRVPLNRAVHEDVRVIRVGLLGYGRIGQAVAAIATGARGLLWDAGVQVRIVRALVRDRSRPRSGPATRVITDHALAVSPDVDVIVEVLGGVEPARTLVTAALKSGVPVVTANKTLMATCGIELRALAERHGTTLAFDAAVLAGVPFLGSLARRPLISAARRIEGIINGTSHFLTGAIERGESFDAALTEAIRLGYAEPDSEADVAGRDAAEKLTILLQLAGCTDLQVSDLTRASLATLDPTDIAAAATLGGRIKPVAVAALDPDRPGAWVGPAFVPDRHPFARLDGVANALVLTDTAGRQVTFAGPGAGPEATAVTIVDDVIETVSRGTAGLPIPAGRVPNGVPASALRTPPAGRWFVHETGGQAVLTDPSPWPEVRAKVAALEARGARVRAWPVLEF